MRSTVVEPGTIRSEIVGAGVALSRSAFVDALPAHRELRALLTDSLRAAPFDAYFWETAPLSPDRAEAPFEFVVVDSPRLAATQADPSAFADRFAGGGAAIVSFANLGGDAELVVPRPLADPAHYAHLAVFVRSAPADQVDALWSHLGLAMRRRRGRSVEPFWVSTSGLGVPWLHVRLDARPKYYAHAAYR